MLPIQQLMAPINDYSRCGEKLKAVKGIVVHWTASFGAPARNIVNYFANVCPQEKRYASAQFSVDDNSIWQCMPEDEMAYAVGSQTYTQEALNRLGSYPNNSTISIEMCIDVNGQFTEATIQNTADLVAYLLKKYGLTINDIWTHRAIVGWKDCPRPWMVYQNGNPVGETAEFDRLKQIVAQKMNPVQAQPVRTLLDGQPINGWTDGYIINDRTHLIWTVVNALKLNYEFKGDGLFVVNGQPVQGHVIGGNTFLQWNLLGVEMTPVQIDGGYNFVTKANTYTVVAGDSLWKISQQFKVSVDTLKRINRLSSDVLSIGQVLVLR